MSLEKRGESSRVELEETLISKSIKFISSSLALRAFARV